MDVNSFLLCKGSYVRVCVCVSPQPSQKTRDPSVRVQSDWEVVHEIEFSQLSKLNFMPGTPKELCVCGSLGYYDVAKEKKISLKTPLPLQSCDRIFHTVTTTDDPVIRRLTKSPECSDCKVFATDTILTTLMTCARSNYSWDIVVQRVEDMLFFDKRDNSQFDLLTVSEKAKEPPTDEAGINAPTSLALEATYINHNFSQQMLIEGQTMDFREPNPFAGDEAGQVASVAYRYMKWQLKEGVGLVARCEYDAVLPPASKPTYASIKALNEWDSKLSGGMDWRKKLDPQRGAVLATELKNNSCKISKWALCAHLAGTSFIKFG
jgi:translation initiation factor 3 subunit D